MPSAPARRARKWEADAGGEAPPGLDGPSASDCPAGQAGERDGDDVDDDEDDDEEDEDEDDDDEEDEDDDDDDDEEDEDCEEDPEAEDGAAPEEAVKGDEWREEAPEARAVPAASRPRLVNRVPPASNPFGVPLGEASPVSGSSFGVSPDGTGIWGTGVRVPGPASPLKGASLDSMDMSIPPPESFSSTLGFWRRAGSGASGGDGCMSGAGEPDRAEIPVPLVSWVIRRGRSFAGREALIFRGGRTARRQGRGSSVGGDRVSVRPARAGKGAPGGSIGEQSVPYLSTIQNCGRIGAMAEKRDRGAVRQAPCPKPDPDFRYPFGVDIRLVRTAGLAREAEGSLIGPD
jgi:hypothetical protein